jgi:imidazolonepropionase
MSASFPRNCDRVWINARLATFDESISIPYGARTEHAIGTRGENIAAIAPMVEIAPDALRGEIYDAQGAWITPGLIDCHTHLVYGGSRLGENERRLAGISYSEISKQGGGIMATVRATRALDESRLLDVSLPRLNALVDEGVTTVEIKSGYGLSLSEELKLLRVIRRIAECAPVNVSATLLAAHALPPEYAGRAYDYVSLICDEIIPAAAKEKLADAVDVFCENIAFSPEQCRRIFDAARKCGLAVKGHMEQLTNLGGSRLAAQYGALSADHLEHLDGPGVQALARSGAVAVLLPGAFYYLRNTQKPPVGELRAAGVPIAVASDLNPGTSPLASIRLAMNFACILFGLTAEEVLAGVTCHAARALGLSDRLGTLSPGKQADFLVWDIEHPAELALQFGVPRLRQRVFKGTIVSKSR